MSITVYSKNNCMQCKMTKRFLEQNNIEFTERNVNVEPGLIDELRDRGVMQMPVVEVDENTSFSGFRPDQLNKLVTSPR